MEDGAIARIEHGQQLLDEVGHLADDLVFVLLGHPLAVVLELGLGAPGEVEVLVALGRGGLERAR